METIKDIGRLLRYVYYLDESDYIYMSSALTRSFDWTIPAVVGGWMFKRLYLIENPIIPKSKKIPLAFLPLICPVLSWSAMYLIYYKSDNHIYELIQKYPSDTNFRLRKKINPFELGRKLKEQAKKPSN